MKKSRLILMAFAVAVCVLFSATMFYGIYCLFSDLEDALQRGGRLAVVIASFLLGIGAGGYSYLSIGAFRELKRELKLRSLKRTTSGGKKDYE